MNLNPGQGPQPSFDLNAWIRAEHEEFLRNVSDAYRAMYEKRNLGVMIRRPIVCADGFTIEVQASDIHRCTPPTSTGPWTAVECRNPSGKVPVRWEWWKCGWGPDQAPVFEWVPVGIVEALIESHGGAK